MASVAVDGARFTLSSTGCTAASAAPTQAKRVFNRRPVHNMPSELLDHRWATSDVLSADF